MSGRPGRRCFSAALALASVAAACGGASDDETVEELDSAPTTSVPTSSSAPSDDGIEPGEGSYVAPLTAESIDVSLVDRRALVVKVGNNDSRSRPQAGLLEADIVFEELIEAVKTRFAAVFHTEIPERIGPVRSGRSSDIDLLDELGTPYVAYSGANTFVLRELGRARRDGAFIDVGLLDFDTPYQRDDERQAPANLYFYFEDLGTVEAEPDSPEANVQSYFEFGSSLGLGLNDIGGITVRYPASFGRESTHIWDSSERGWVRIQDGTLHVAETGVADQVAEIAPTNVVVIQSEYEVSEADPDSPELVSFGSGSAWVLTDGKVQEAEWERTDGELGFRFVDSAGAAIRLAPGSTWVLFGNDGGWFPDAEIELISTADAAEMLDAARAEFEAAE